MQPEKKDWKKLVAGAKGQLMFVPESLIPKYKKLLEMRAEFDKALEQVAKNEIEHGTMNNDIMLEFRKHAESVGVKIWQKEVNLEASALRDGEYIIVISEPMRQVEILLELNFFKNMAKFKVLIAFEAPVDAVIELTDEQVAVLPEGSVEAVTE